MVTIRNVGPPDSVLIVLPTWVGDFVMATPLLRAVRDRFAEARIVFLAEANLRDLIRGGDWMDEVVQWPAKDRRMPWHSEYRELVFDLRKRRFDLAILLPNSFRSAMLARLAGAKRRIGYNRDGRGFLLTDRVPVKNREENWWRNTLDAPIRAPGASPAVNAKANPRARDKGSESILVAAVRQAHQDAPGESKPPRHHLTTSLPRHIPTSPPHQILPGPRIWPGAHAAVQMGTNIPADLGPYRPMPLVEYYADLAEAIGCERPGDRLELFTTPDCDESVQERLGSLGISGGKDAFSAPLAKGGLRGVENTTLANDSGLGRQPLVVISPGAKFGASKCWPAERFAATADRLIETAGATIIITCGPGEEPIAREIARPMKHAGLPASPSATADLRDAPLGKGGRGGFVFDNPRLSLGELKSLIRRSDLLLCNDAGPRHIAKAFGVPVVTVFGPTHPDWTATSDEAERIVRMDTDCGPCQQKVCPLGHQQCLTSIDADIVHAACTELLNAKRAMPAEPMRTASGSERA